VLLYDAGLISGLTVFLMVEAVLVAKMRTMGARGNEGEEEGEGTGDGVVLTIGDTEGEDVGESDGEGEGAGAGGVDVDVDVVASSSASNGSIFWASSFFVDSFLSRRLSWSIEKVVACLLLRKSCA
jgi:hypothetical protein